MVLTYNGGTKKMKIFNNGKLVQSQGMLDFDSFNCPGGLTLGNDGKSNKFMGII